MDLGPGPAGAQQLQELILRAIGLSVTFAFIVLTIMLFVGGFKFLTSAGDPKNLQSARQTALWAVLGIGFLILAWIVLRIIEAFTGVPVTNFCLGFAGGPNNCVNV